MNLSFTPSPNYLAVENPRIQHLMPPNPEIHNRDALPGLFDRHIPLSLDQITDERLHFSAREDPLRLIGAEHSRPHGGRDQGLGVA